MTSVLDTVRGAVGAVRPGRPTCASCNRPVSRGDDRMQLRGGIIVHRRCATYVLRRRRTGADRLGYPRR